MKNIYIIKGIEYLEEDRTHKRYVNYTFFEDKTDASKRLTKELNKMRKLGHYVNGNYVLSNHGQIIEYMTEKINQIQ